MSAPMAVQTYRGLKTETRRLTGLEQINEAPDQWIFKQFLRHKDQDCASFVHKHNGAPKLVPFPYGGVMDYLWIRENYRFLKIYEYQKPSAVQKWSRVWYEADGSAPKEFGRMRPSIHMPRWASRGRIKIHGIGAERLHAITEEAAYREGAQRGICNSDFTFKGQDCLQFPGWYYHGFKYLWATINGRDNWDLNPWVWPLKFVLETAPAHYINKINS